MIFSNQLAAYKELTFRENVVSVTRALHWQEMHL
jgi:hypothetical protein